MSKHIIIILYNTAIYDDTKWNQKWNQPWESNVLRSYLYDPTGIWSCVRSYWDLVIQSIGVSYNTSPLKVLTILSHSFILHLRSLY